MPNLGNSGLNVSKLCFGGNVFSWTIDEAESFRVLDSFLDGGGNFVDTSDTYTSWIDGHTGGESEAIIGNWLSSRKIRDRIVLATKVGQKPDRKGMAPANIRVAVDEGLARLQVDSVDLLYAHIDDQAVPLQETLETLDEIVRQGKARFLAASNYTGPRFREAVDIQKQAGYARFVTLQPHYNLLRRDIYEGELLEVCSAEGISCVPYFGLASGVLTGKYRNDPSSETNPRAGYVAKYLDDPRTAVILDVVAEIAQDYGVGMGAIALAWLAAQPTVASPIASARNPEQLAALLPMLELELKTEEIDRLDLISRASTGTRG